MSDKLIKTLRRAALLLVLICALKGLSAYLDTLRPAQPVIPEAQQTHRPEEITRLATSFRQIADDIKAGREDPAKHKYDSVTQVLIVTRAANQQILGDQTANWEKWGNDLKSKLERIKAGGQLTTVDDVEREWRIVADALQQELQQHDQKATHGG